MERKYLEIELKGYLDELYKFCPYFEEYLDLNNTIASYILDIYDQSVVPQSEEYQQIVNVNDSILLAHEIISSISPDLGTKFMELINQQRIYFISKEKQDFSCTYELDGISYSTVVDYNNICTVICLVHEFFHNIHLDKYNGDMNNVDWFFYTEIFGLMGDLYSVYYLLKEKPEITSDIKNYLCQFFESIVACSDKCLLTGTIIDIYTQKKSLSTQAIKEYVQERGLSKESENILNLMPEEDDDYIYNVEVPYIFAFPVAFQLSVNLLTEPKYKHIFAHMFDKIDDMPSKKWFETMGLLEHTVDPNKLHEIMHTYYTYMLDIYKLDDQKIKKIGEL